MEKYLKSIDRTMKGIHEELKKMNRQSSTQVTNIEVKKDDINGVANDIANQIRTSAGVNISRGL